MKNNLLIIILVIIIGLVAFWYLGKGSPDNGSSLSVDVQTSNSADATYIYNILQQMAQVTLDDSIFSNSVFQNLKDNTVSFSPQAAGRPNPFSPVGTDVNVSGQTAKSATNSIQ